MAAGHGRTRGRRTLMRRFQRDTLINWACFTADSEASGLKDRLKRRMRNRTSGGVGGRGLAYRWPLLPDPRAC